MLTQAEALSIDETNLVLKSEQRGNESTGAPYSKASELT